MNRSQLKQQNKPSSSIAILIVAVSEKDDNKIIQQGLLLGKPEWENKELCFWNIGLIVFQDGVNDVAHLSLNSANTDQMLFEKMA